MTDETVPWRQVAAFCALVLVLPWGLLAPFHLGLWAFEGITAAVTAMVMMWVPTLATVILLLTADRSKDWARRTGVELRGIDAGRLVKFLAVAAAVPAVASYASPFVAAALGQVQLDLVEFSGLRELMEMQLEASGASFDIEALGVPLWVIVLASPVNVLFGGALNVVLGAFGEELGWRGWLLPKLLPLGVWPALLAVGALWGIWHAPVILLGHNYPDAPVLGLLLFVPFCMIWGVLHGWVRLATGSVWPSALMHGTLNASAGFFMMVVAAGQDINTVWMTPVGLSGMLMPLGMVAVLVWWSLAGPGLRLAPSRAGV